MPIYDRTFLPKPVGRTISDVGQNSPIGSRRTLAVFAALLAVLTADKWLGAFPARAVGGEQSVTESVPAATAAADIWHVTAGDSGQ